MKKKNDKTTVQVFLDGETLKFYKKLSQLAGMDLDSCISIVIAMGVMKHNAQQTDKKTTRSPRKVR